MSDRRIYSRDRHDIEDDLRASLEFVRDEGLIDEFGVRAVIRMFISHCNKEPQHLPHAQTVLRILSEENLLAFGLACRFHLEAQTSVTGDVEVVLITEMKRRVLTVGDLGWPNSILDGYDPNAVPEDPALDARLESAIRRWREAYDPASLSGGDSNHRS